MKHCWIGITLVLFVTLLVGCVTQTERIPYHRYMGPPEEEGMLDELRREFGWQKPPPWVKEEPFYKRAAQGIKNTVSGWFGQEEQPPTPLGGRQSLREFQKEQQEAMRRLQEQQQNEQRGQNIDNRPTEETRE
ncbi:MAG: hypothetical protein AB7G75_33370 [Candidatus Binatia bacterium]